MQPPLPPPQPPPTPPSRMGWVLLAHLGLVLLLHLVRQLVNDDVGIFPMLFLLAFGDLLAFFVLLFSGRWRLGLGFLLAGLLVFLIGFGDCATHLHLGPMH
ncbi:hypothetical protein EJV47_07995 [Hymenobacter gummosus]|uniref:Uncharacterized protein n=1 Tax=Hymenobacter gummosus TaxID=1776032 RepID=A0A431U5T5_9BACT|nr:hypothetical protein [Hymenobacter gummosus]RTQ51725.1 hypothetical protein EJV47_07995 [Hymenobacter gummosus]